MNQFIADAHRLVNLQADEVCCDRFNSEVERRHARGEHWVLDFAQRVAREMELAIGVSKLLLTAERQRCLTAIDAIYGGAEERRERGEV